VTGVLVLAFALPAVGAAAAAPAPGWPLVQRDEFDGASLDRARWATYGGPYGDAGGVYWREDDVLVSGGLLRIRMQRRGFGGKPFTAGGLIGSLAQTYGRYEFRARVPRGKGIDSYATLWPKRGDDRDAALVELLAPGPETAHLTYTIEWTPSRFRILFDGVPWLDVSRHPGFQGRSGSR
jgi:hypothetical protein